MGTPTDLADIREQIDALDSQIRDLLRARAGLVDAVALAKASSRDDAPLRPAREAAQIEALAAWQQTEASNLPLAGLIAIWREIISVGLAQQGGLTIYHTAESSAAARAHFGASLSYRSCDSADAALVQASTQAAQDKRALAIISLADAQPAPAGLQVVACLPLLGPATALCYGLENDEDGNVTLVQAGPDTQLTASQIIYRDAAGVLAELDDVLTDDAVRTQLGPDARVLGRYARPLRRGTAS